MPKEEVMRTYIDTLLITVALVVFLILSGCSGQKAARWNTRGTQLFSIDLPVGWELSEPSSSPAIGDELTHVVLDDQGNRMFDILILRGSECDFSLAPLSEYKCVDRSGIIYYSLTIAGDLEPGDPTRGTRALKIRTTFETQENIEINVIARYKKDAATLINKIVDSLAVTPQKRPPAKAAKRH
jgi:hypothetical protein